MVRLHVRRFRKFRLVRSSISTNTTTTARIHPAMLAKTAHVSSYFSCSGNYQTNKIRASYKSKEHIHKKDNGPDCTVSDNLTSYYIPSDNLENFNLNSPFSSQHKSNMK